MLAFFLRRVVQLVLVLFLVSTVLFVLLRLSGDPALLLAGPSASPQLVAAIRHDLGLDASLLTQYGVFLRGVATLDFGTSITTGQDALSVVFDHLPYTALLAVSSLLVALTVGGALGIWSGVSRRRGSSALVHGLALGAQSVPSFWLGTLLVFVFAVELNWLPSFGSGGVAHLLLPAVTLAAWPLAKTMLLLRGSVREVQSMDYVRTARAKGVPRTRRTLRHVVPNALTAVASVAGMDFAELLGGAVITETVFAWPGVGQLLLQSVSHRDYPVVQATVFVVAFLVVLINMLVDLLYRLLDPRMELA